MNTFAVILAVSFLPFFEARNQVANFVIDPPPEGAEAAKPEKPALIVTTPCTVCEGKGELLLVEPDYGQTKGRIGSGSKKLRRECPICRGKGKVRAYVNPTDLVRQVAEDRAAFAAKHQGRGEIAVGEAFVKNEKYATLDRDRKKLVENAYGHPCRRCNWTGIEECRKCSGNGTVKCGNPDCKGGWAVVKTTTESSVSKSGNSNRVRGCCGGYRSSSRQTRRKETKISVTPCPECGGASRVKCAECGGMRAQPCGQCKGLGIKVKGQW